MAKQKFYVVWRGRRTGIFKTWEECSASVSGYPHAEYKAFESFSSAEVAFNQPYNNYKGKPATLGNWRLAKVKPLVPAICVDAACAGSPGPLEYRGVELETGKEIFKQGVFEDGTNNVGEFLTIVHALAWMKEKNKSLPLYTDSENALLWVSAKKCRTKLIHTKKNDELFQLIQQAEIWLIENTYENKLLKWETTNWGENPADFGRK